MATKRDYYEVLGISKSATADDIKRAFRKKAMEFHPDRNKAPDAEAKFKEVNEAYETLSDPQKRQQYDHYGHAGSGSSAGFGGAGGFEDIFKNFFNQGRSRSNSDDFVEADEDEEEDFFNNLFGTGRSRRSSTRRTRDPYADRNVEVEMEISFVDMLRGAEKHFNYPYTKVCPHCHGTGAETPSDIKTCSRCNGTGVINIRQQTPFGVMQSQSVCPDCKGKGKIITKKCHECHGSGKVSANGYIEMMIPPGIDNGAIIRINGKGNDYGTVKGDLLVHVYIKKSSIFERKGTKIYCKVIVDPLIAIMGGKIDVPTPYGFRQVELKPGTTNEEIITLTNAGINTKKGIFTSKGDLHVIIIYGKPSHYNKSDLDKLRSVSDTVNSEVEQYLKKAKSEIN
jgi:molecular chaperone DnaJ